VIRLLKEDQESNRVALEKESMDHESDFGPDVVEEEMQEETKGECPEPSSARFERKSIASVIEDEAREFNPRKLNESFGSSAYAQESQDYDYGSTEFEAEKEGTPSDELITEEDQ